MPVRERFANRIRIKSRQITAKADPYLARSGLNDTRMVLSSKPDAALLGDDFSEEVTNKVASEIESLWHVYAESTSKHIDASRQRTLTDMVRMACVNFMIEGEFLATVEWRPGQKFGTKIQPVDIARLPAS